VLKLLSEQYKLPIVLWSLDPAVPFYEQIGLLHLNNPEVQKKVMFGNVEIKELKEKINNNDFVYMPQSLYRRKPIIYL
jgi:tmRNA-binding protein